MSTPTSRTAPTMPPPVRSAVAVDGDHVVIEGLEVTDGVLATVLSRADDPESALRQILAVGARGVISMGTALDLEGVETRIRETLVQTSAATREGVDRLLGETGEAIRSMLDPAADGSVTARTLSEFDEWRSSLLDRLDPDRASSHTGRTLTAMQALLAPGGPLEERLKSELDPTRPGSGLAAISELIERKLGHFHASVAAEQGRAEEAERGTMKGFAFEDTVEEALRRCARGMGAIVERTSHSSGDLARIVGDHVVTLADGSRVVVEAKNTRSMSLAGSGGILAELDDAMANRDAGVAICISRHPDAWPREVGPINVYGNRILVCDDGEGTLIWVALRWAAQLIAARNDGAADMDSAGVRDGLQRIEQLAERLKTSRAALTQISSSVGGIHESLGQMRSDLLEIADELGRRIFRASDTGPPAALDRAV